MKNEDSNFSIVHEEVLKKGLLWIMCVCIWVGFLYRILNNIENSIFSMVLEEVLKMFPLDNVCLDLSGISLQNFNQQRDLPHRPGRAK